MVVPVFEQGSMLPKSSHLISYIPNISRETIMKKNDARHAFTGAKFPLCSTGGGIL
jgi:hypothetical protein